MANMNLRTKIEPNEILDIRKIYLARRDKVTERDKNSKEIQVDNDTLSKEIIKLFANKSHMNNVRMIIKDNIIELAKQYLISKGSTPKISFDISVKVPSLASSLRTVQKAKEFPQLIEKNVRILNKLIKTNFSNNTISQIQHPFMITIDTKTRYSF
jgi:hypothetical protein